MLYLSDMLVEFSLTCIFHHVWKINYGDQIPRNFTHTPLPHLKLQVEYFENFPQQQKGMEQIMICFIKFELENMKKA